MIDQILGSITQERLVELGQTLIGIPSVTGEEAPISEYVYQFLKDLGLAVQKIPVEDAGPTLVGYLRGRSDDPRFMVNFHLDTFPQCEGWTHNPYRSPPEHYPNETRLYGLGAHDMKGGAACILAAVEAIVQFGAQLQGTLVVTATTDEELWSRGAHALIKGGHIKGCTGCLIPEPTPLHSLWRQALDRVMLHHARQQRPQGSAVARQGRQVLLLVLGASHKRRQTTPGNTSLCLAVDALQQQHKHHAADSPGVVSSHELPQRLVLLRLLVWPIAGGVAHLGARGHTRAKAKLGLGGE